MGPAHLDRLAAVIDEAAPPGFDFTLDASGEHSDFVRFNHARVRQAGSVVQAHASVRLLQGKRHATQTVTLSGDADEDGSRLRASVALLASMVPALPEDPHLLLPDQVCSTQQVDPVQIPETEEVVDTVTGAAAGTDFVGIYAGGTLWRGFANRQGQRNWFETGGTLLDYSLVHSADKAVKASVGGKIWDGSAIGRSVGGAREQLTHLARPSLTIPPGSYRAYLAPDAVAEIVELIGWGGFSAYAQQIKASPIQRLVQGEVSLSPLVHIAEDTAGGIGPNFQGEGFVRPERVALVQCGRHAGSLVSPRSAAEYGLVPNGADGRESPEAVSMAGGEMADEEVLARLGTGVWVSNLWYLNYSDRNNARMTGMTRFATFWVENGEIVAPLSVMRFDASLFDLFGPLLEALTRRTSFLPSASTYGGRSTDSATVPGALISGLPFTL